MKKNRIIISGGGTGGHIFPALSIADEIKKRRPDTEILFVGADNRMEMERVPAAGYKIKGLPVQGLKRQLTLKNVKVILDYMKSRKMAKNILKDFKPDIAIGVGGYASAPVLKSASKLSIPTLLQEQNSYAGVTNKLLARKAKKICVAYNDMELYFPADKIEITGNPVRNIVVNDDLKKEGIQHFGLSGDKLVLFIMGGSLGARTLNQALLQGFAKLQDAGVEVLWQTGKYYNKSIKEELADKDLSGIKVLDFVSRMDLAYNVSDVIVSRAGALSLSEICLVGKPSILVPSPNVAEDHQTKNAMALVNMEAARMVRDKEAAEKLIDTALQMLSNPEDLKIFGINASKLAKPDATKTIVDRVFEIIDE